MNAKVFLTFPSLVHPSPIFIIIYKEKYVITGDVMHDTCQFKNSLLLTHNLMVLDTANGYLFNAGDRKPLRQKQQQFQVMDKAPNDTSFFRQARISQKIF